MSLFSQEQANKYSDNEHEVLLIDRIVEEANKVLLQEKKSDLHRVKSTLFDIVILKRLLDRLKINIDFPEPIKSIRDSISHVDERLDEFDFKPTTIKGEAWAREENSDGRFKLSNSHNFQGAIAKAEISITGEVRAVGPYGMIDDNFIWIDRKGRQNHTAMEDIRVAYLAFLKSANKVLGAK